MPTVIYLNRYVDFRSKDSNNFGNKNLTIWVSLDLQDENNLAEQYVQQEYLKHLE